jgi:hypothetical protein
MHTKTSPAIFTFFALAICFAFAVLADAAGANVRPANEAMSNIAAAHAATSPTFPAANAEPADQGSRQEYIKVVEAARRDAPAFLALIPEGRENGFGFAHHQEIAGAVIGDAYQVLTPSLEFAQGETVPAGKELVEAGEWWVTVRSGERNALVMIVALVESDWQVVAMGMTHQAMELESFKKNNNARPENIQILRTYTFQADFILSSPAGDSKTSISSPDMKVYPMMTAQKSFPGAMEKSAFSMEELLQWLRIQYMEL